MAAGDISEFIPKEEADVAVLEEPEHLTWYYHGKRWTDKFQHVVGIVHTNYLEYVKREKNGAATAFLLEHINNWMVRAYCNKVLFLVAALSLNLFEVLELFCLLYYYLLDGTNRYRSVFPSSKLDCFICSYYYIKLYSDNSLILQFF